MTTKNAPTIKSADDLIVQEENRKLGLNQPGEAHQPKPPAQQEGEGEQQPNQEDKSVSDQDASESPSKEEEGKPEGQEPAPLEDSKSDSQEESSDDETDDYGNPIGKSKTYTEEQVQLMIRDRLARDRQARGQQPANPQQDQQVRDAAKKFEIDPNNPESAVEQLENFIESTIEKMNTKQQNREWQQKEETVQAEFEEKFTTGMGKYSDFKDVVADKPITNSMMMATRSMQDPAAFVYAACKQHPQELARIAQIKDPYAQIAEIGRLEERMKKAKVVTKAPPPPKKVVGDSTDDMPKQSIDQLIHAHAKTKIMNKR